jgi:hypothetical protein
MKGYNPEYFHKDITINSINENFAKFYVIYIVSMPLLFSVGTKSFG